MSLISTFSRSKSVIIFLSETLYGTSIRHFSIKL